MEPLHYLEFQVIVFNEVLDALVPSDLRDGEPRDPSPLHIHDSRYPVILV